MTTPARAARLNEHAAPLEIVDVELPDPGPGEVRVELAFAGINPIDRYNALGRVAADGPLPRTLGSEASGHLEGAPVLVRGHGLGAQRDGVWASAAVVPKAAVVPLPDGVDLAAAACLGVAGLTAWRTVCELARVQRDDRVLVLGASGGVGSVICALAAARGAVVWGQTGNAEKSGFITASGATRTVVADAAGLAGAVAELRPTVVFDPLGGAFTAAALTALSRNGRLVLFGTSAGTSGELPLQHLYRNGQAILGYGGGGEPEERARPALEAAIAAYGRGELTITVDTVWALESVNTALERLASRAVRGQLVLDVAVR